LAATDALAHLELKKAKLFFGVFSGPACKSHIAGQNG